MPADEGVVCCPVSLRELKAHLRIEHDEEDGYLRSLLAMAWGASRDFCKREAFPRPAPQPVRLAILLFTGHYYTHRENGERQAFETMKWAFEGLLWPYRDLTKLV